MVEIQDVSTFSGALSRIWFRWKYTLLSVLILVGVVFAVSQVLTNSDLLSSGDIPESTFVKSGNKLTYHGSPLKFDLRYFDPFPSLPSPNELQDDNSENLPIDTIEIKWVRISGPNFTAQLAQYAPTLKVLHLDNVTIEDHLQPLDLPKLEEFFLNQGAQPEETNSPDYILNHGPTPWLLSTLFFINDNSSDFATKAALAYNRPVNVTVFLKGSVAYQVNPGYKEVRLDISNCSDILRKLPQTFTILTLGRCKDLTSTSIHSKVTFLNFYIVYVSNELLSSILKNIKDLEEFYAEIPDGPVEIKLQDLSPKLRILSVSSMNIIPGKGSSYPNIKEFYFGAENQYGWLENRVTSLNESIFLNFATIFPQVEKVGLFDVKDEDRYIFLRSVLQTPTVRWIVVENFGRLGNNSIDVGSNINAYLYVENQLDNFGLEKDTVDFVVEVDNSTETMVAREITKMEKLWYRFTYLGWCPIDSWPKFLYVEGIIENGGILGEWRPKEDVKMRKKI